MKGVAGSEGMARKVPRGPEEWGEVLIEPLWVYERTRKDMIMTYLGWGMIFLSVLWGFWIVGYLSEGPAHLLPGRLGFVLMGSGIFAIMGLIMLLSNAKTMPFRVYEAGFTKIQVPQFTGMRLHEVLVPKEHIKRVEVKSHTVSDAVHRHISINYEEGGGEKTQYVSHQVVDDPLSTLIALERIVPDRLDPSVYKFVGRQGEDPVIHPPGSMDSRLRFSKAFIWMMLISGFLLSVFSGALVSFHPERAWTSILMTGLVASLAPIMFVALTLFLAHLGHLWHVAVNVRREGDRLVLPEPGLFGRFVDARTYVPLKEVREVRLGLEKIFYHSLGRLLLTNGDRIEVPYNLFEELSGDPNFVRDGIVLTNTSAGTDAGPPVVAINFLKGTMWSFLMVLTALVTALIVYLNPGLSFPELFDDEAVLILQIVFLVIISVGFLLIMRKMMRDNQMTKEMMAMDKGIAMPHAPEAWKFIPAESVRTISVKKTFWGHRLDLETDKGTVALPISAYEVLEEGGWTIEDPTGILPRTRT